MFKIAQFRVLQEGISAARQLEREITEACRRGLAEGRRKFDGMRALPDWRQRREEVDRVFRESLPALLGELAPLQVRPVSTYEFHEFIVENVLFYSLPGWEVNAAVYRPRTGGPWPSVICPTGHSSKFGPSYTASAQTFARNGYLAVSFCPPGCSGELARLNDHFANGVIGWMTGIWAMTYFMADALACISYLEQRSDVDASRGFAMTGVSGGGLTSMFCAAYDPRITFAAPVCCISSQEALHLTGLYTSCPEQHGRGYLGQGIDVTEILSLIAPKRLCLVGGKLDEVFEYTTTVEVYERVKRVYELYGCGENVSLFLQEDSGHAYTVAMANEVVGHMDAFFEKETWRAPMTEGGIQPIAREQLACYPKGCVNMFTVNCQEALRLQAQRPKLTEEQMVDSLSSLLQLEGITPHLNRSWAEPEESLPKRWHHIFQPVILHHGDQNVLPGVFAYREGAVACPALLYIDEKGKWNGFNHQGVLTQVIGLAQPASDAERCVLSVDVSGMGELEAQHTTYDSASWNDIERILTYLSIAEGRPLIAYQVRDALTALAYLRTRPEVDPKRIILAGDGVGAVVALLAGLLARDQVERVVALNPLAAYACLATAFPYRWPEMILIPEVLKYWDLPDLVATLGSKAVCIQPLDEMRRPLSEGRMLTYYGGAIAAGAQVLVAREPEKEWVQVCKGM